MTGPVARWVAEALGSKVVASGHVGGGDVAAASWHQLDDGRRVFAKTRAGTEPDFFATEALSLAWLRDANTLPVPEVLHVGETHPLLVLEWIEPGGPRPDTERDFGAALAQLHQAEAPCFGREDERTTGSRGLPNTPCDTWAEFFATQRLLPLVKLATDEGRIPAAVIDAVEAVTCRLSSLGVPDEPPARLHGDLWAGNRMIGAGGKSWLIDPAAHGGHREFDLAMMQLFGGFGAACFRAYDETFPLAAGWQDRIALHQLAPLLVHAIKFGSAYYASTANAAGRYL